MGPFYSGQTDGGLAIGTLPIYVGFAIRPATLLNAEESGYPIPDRQIRTVFLIAFCEILGQSPEQKQKAYNELQIIEEHISGNHIEHK